MTVIECYQDEEYRQNCKGQAPGQRYVAGAVLKIACQNHKPPLTGDTGYTIECRADSDVRRLIFRVQFEHIITVGRNIVGS